MASVQLEPERQRGRRGRGLHRQRMLHNHAFAVAVTVVLLIASGFLLVAMAFTAGREAVVPIDQAVHDYVQDHRWSPLRVTALAFNWAGAWFVTGPLRLVVAAWLAWVRRWERFAMWALSSVVAEAAIGLLKTAYARPRPPNPLVAVSTFSFPSGHAVAGAVIAVGLVVVLVAPGPRRRYLEVLAGWFVFVMAASRIYLNAHWLSDVVAGTALGAAIVLGSAALVQAIGDQLDRRSQLRIAQDAGKPGIDSS